MKPLDLVGQRFGRGVVVAPLPSRVRAGRHTRMWRLKCDCGTEYDAETTNLRNGDVRSCGCLQKETFAKNARLFGTPAITKAPGVAAFNCLVGEYKRNARTRNLDWRLSGDEIRSLVFRDCYYCGQPPSRVQRRHGGEGRGEGATILVNGIDRLDPNRGYTPDNCVPCCFPCNSAKRDMAEGDFLGWIERVHAHIQRGGNGE